MKLNIFTFIGLTLLVVQSICAQSSQKAIVINGRYESLQQDNIASISSFPFEGKFAVHLATDDQSNYFLLNLSLLNGEFERQYFIKEVYKNQLFIQYGHGMPVGKAWLLTDTKTLPEDVITMLTNLLANVKSVSATMSESEKNTWLSSPTN